MSLLQALKFRQNKQHPSATLLLNIVEELVKESEGSSYARIRNIHERYLFLCLTEDYDPSYTYSGVSSMLRKLLKQGKLIGEGRKGYAVSFLGKDFL